MKDLTRSTRPIMRAMAVTASLVILVVAGLGPLPLVIHLYTVENHHHEASCSCVEPSRSPCSSWCTSDHAGSTCDLPDCGLRDLQDPGGNHDDHETPVPESSEADALLATNHRLPAAHGHNHLTCPVCQHLSSLKLIQPARLDTGSAGEIDPETSSPDPTIHFPIPIPYLLPPIRCPPIC